MTITFKTGIVAIAAAALGAICLPTLSQACTYRGGVIKAEVEALNTALEKGDYAKLQETALMMGGMDLSAIAEQLETAFPDGFTDCITIEQREEVGGMTQTMTSFVASNSVLYVKWLSTLENGKVMVITFNMDTDASAVLATLR